MQCLCSVKKCDVLSYIWGDAPHRRTACTRNGHLYSGIRFGFKRKSITVPSVLSMFWKNPAGKIACALANVSDETKIVDIPVDSYMKHIQKVFVEINGYEKDTGGI